MVDVEGSSPPQVVSSLGQVVLGCLKKSSEQAVGERERASKQCFFRASVSVPPSRLLHCIPALVSFNRL